MALPKYVIQKRNGYYYQRFYPATVAKMAPAKKFTIPLGVKVGATDRQIAKAAITAGGAFDLKVATLSNSAPNAVDQASIDMLADVELKRMKRRDRDLDPTIMQRLDNPKHEWVNKSGKKIRMPKGGDLVVATLPSGEPIAAMRGQNVDITPDIFRQIVEMKARDKLDELMQDMPEDREVDRLVKQRVKERLATRAKSGPRTLSQLWEPYCKFKGYEIDESNYRYRKKRNDYNHAMACIGDHEINDDTAVEINRGLKERVENMIRTGVRPSSAIRSIAMTAAMFKWAADEYDLNWRIKSVRAPSEEPSERQTATRDEMILVAQKCVEWNDIQGVIGVMACHGIIPSEIARLKVTKGLQHEIPYVLLPPGKTAHRKRLVPIMWGFDVLLDHIDDAIEYCKTNNDPSATFNKRLRSMLDGEDKITLYGCRHGCRNLYLLADPAVPTGLLQATLGWSGGDQGMHLHYGASGIEDGPFIRELHNAGKRAHRPIIEALEG